MDQVAKLEQTMMPAATGSVATAAPAGGAPEARPETAATPALNEVIGALAMSAQDVRAQLMGKPTKLQVAEGEAERPTGVPTRDIRQAALYAAIAQAKVLYQVGQEEGCLQLLGKAERLARQS